MSLTYGTVFSGIEGFGAGLDRAGMRCAWQVERDPACNRVLARHWPAVARHGDVKELDTDDLAPVDLICGGFPCQDLSVAGQRAGLGGERSGLFWELARIVAARRPRWLVVENVPGLLSAVCPDSDGRPVPAGGCEGGCMARHGGAMGIVIGTLAELGYVGCWRVLDARYFALAQRRERVFIVCHLGDRARAQEVLLEPQGVRRHPAKGRKAGEVVAALTADGVGTCGADDNQAQAGHLVAAYQCHGSDYAHQLTTGGGKPGQGYPAVTNGIAVRRLTPTECERLQGFPDGHTAGESDSARYRMLGNAVPVPVAEWIGRRIVAVETRDAA